LDSPSSSSRRFIGAEASWDSNINPLWAYVLSMYAEWLAMKIASNLATLVGILLSLITIFRQRLRLRRTSDTTKIYLMVLAL